MANPTVEKLKEVGLRFGDKVAVALTSLLFVLCLGSALSKQSINITPDEVKKSAEAAESNINRPQDRDRIISSLEAGPKGIKATDFSRQVEDASKTVLLASNYKPEREWVNPEPGAGLIREKPELIAPTDLYAYPGRGGALVYALDEQGSRIPDTEKKDATKEAPRPARRRRRAAHGGAGGSMMGGMMGGGMRKKGARPKSQAEIEREQKAEYEEKKREMAAKLVATDDDTDKSKEDETKKDAAASQQHFKEVTKGLRWIAITGVLDHGKMIANYRRALKNSAAANPHYARLDLERQTRQKDGSWSKWDKVDSDENLKILDNLPEEDEEMTPDSVRPDNLNDPLPFLKAGLWEKVHIASLVPKEKKEVAPPPPTAGMMGGMMGGSSMSSMMGGSSMSRMMGGSSMSRMMGGSSSMMGSGGMRGQMPAGSMSSSMSSSSMMGMRGMMGGMGGMMGGSGDTGKYWKSEEKRVMIRALDFTAAPDNSYRYRVRIVVFNPNHGRDDVAYGTDTKSTELLGPWSEPTDEVDMPADVAAYAMGTLPAAKSELKVNFQVVRFDEHDGVTIPSKFAASPGQVIGEIANRDIPTSEGTGKKIKPVDFNTHQIVLDAAGGQQALPPSLAGGALDRPALTLLLRNDGSVLARTEAEDVSNEVRKDIERNYAREIKDSNKKRESSMGSGYGSMMGGSMMGSGGMMGGGRR